MEFSCSKFLSRRLTTACLSSVNFGRTLLHNTYTFKQTDGTFSHFSGSLCFYNSAILRICAYPGSNSPQQVSSLFSLIGTISARCHTKSVVCLSAASNNCCNNRHGQIVSSMHDHAWQQCPGFQTPQAIGEAHEHSGHKRHSRA